MDTPNTIVIMHDGRLRIEDRCGIVMYVDVMQVLEVIPRSILASAFGKEGGHARSARKSAAARINGRKGGRPRKT